MRVKELAELANISPQAIRKKTKKAFDNDLNFITVNDVKYNFLLVNGVGGRGQVYEYYEVIKKLEKPKDELLSLEAGSTIVLENISKPTAEDKRRVLVHYLYMQRAYGTTIVDYIEYLNGLYRGFKLTFTKFNGWRKKFESGGMEALEDKRGGNNNKIDMELVREVVIAYGTRTKTNQFKIYNILYAKKYKGVENFNGWKRESHIDLSTFHKAYDRFVLDDRNAYLLGTKGQDALFSEVIARKRFDITECNAEWQIDATPLDVMVHHPHLEIVDGKLLEVMSIKRMTVIAIVDSFSKRRVWGLYSSANSYANVRLLKKALMKFGKPKVLKGDNGKDYVSKHFQGVLEELGIHYIKGRPYKGADKGIIERNFRTILHGDVELLSGFIGHDVAQRQVLESQAVSKDKRLGGDKSYVDVAYTSVEMEAILDRIIENEANDRGWNENWSSFYEVTGNEPFMFDEAVVNRSIGKRRAVKIGREGVRYNNNHYFNDLLVHRGLINSRCIVAENIDDISRVNIFSEDGAFICEAVNTKIMKYSVEEWRALQKVHTKELREVVKAAEKAKKAGNEAMAEILDIKGIRAEIKNREDAVAKRESQEQLHYEIVNSVTDKTEQFMLEHIKKVENESYGT